MPAGGSALKAAFRGLGKIGPGWSAAGGAAAGALTGAVSNDTSVRGGALTGAAMGFGGYGLARQGMRSALVYKRAVASAVKQGIAPGVAKGQARALAFRSMGRNSSRFFGSAFTKAKNAIISPTKGTKAGAAGQQLDLPFGQGRPGPTQMELNFQVPPGPRVSDYSVQMGLPGIGTNTMIGSKAMGPQLGLNLSASAGAGSRQTSFNFRRMEAQRRLDRIRTRRDMGRVEAAAGGPTNWNDIARRSARRQAAENRLSRIRQGRTAREDVRSWNAQQQPGSQLGLF
jgi:hypothetical protein